MPERPHPGAPEPSPAPKDTPIPPPSLPKAGLSGLDLPDPNAPETLERHFWESLRDLAREESLPLPKTRWYQRFLRPRRRRYPDGGGEDPFPMEGPCVKGRRHAFIERSFQEDSCQPTVPKRIYLCRKCGKVYRGFYPTRYGDIVGEDPISDLDAEWEKRGQPSRRKRWPLVLPGLLVLLLLLSHLGKGGAPQQPSSSAPAPVIQTELDFAVEDGTEPIEVETYLESDWYLYLYDSAYLDLWLDTPVTHAQLKARVRANPDIPAAFRDFLCLFIDRLAEKQPQAELRPFYENLKTLKVVECDERELLMASLSADSSGCYVSSENCIYVLKDKTYTEGTWDFQVMFHELCHAMRTYRRAEKDPRLGKDVLCTAGLYHCEVLPDEMFNSVFAVSLFDYDEWDIAYQLQSNYLVLLLQSTDAITATDYMNHSQSWLYRRLDEFTGHVNYAETIFRLIQAQYDDYHSDRIDYPPETFYPLYDYLSELYLNAHLAPGSSAEEASAVMDAMLERLLFDVPEGYAIPADYFYQYLESYLARTA